MDWKELQEKYTRLQAQGESAQNAAEMLKDDICVFAKECVEHPEKATDAMPEFGKIMQDNPVLSDLFFFLFFRPRGGWGL